MAEDRTEAPTPQKRQKAREEGRAAVSRDLSAGASLLAACIAARLTWPLATATLVQASQWTVTQVAHSDLGLRELAQLAQVWGRVAAQALAPTLAAAACTGLLVSLAQTRLIFSFKPLQPTLEKVSPVHGLKRIFSLRGLVEGAKSALKVAVVLGVAGWVLWVRREDLARLSDCSTPAAAELILALAYGLALRIGALLVVLGVADYAYQWWEFERSIRMSRHELREEYKQYEGDPHVRARRRAIQRNMLQQGISPQAKDATVVVTNPTHLAVALLYRSGMFAPRIVAKGRYRVAERIVSLAQARGIPVVRNVELARALYKSARVGDYVPGALYQAVAEVLVMLYRQAQERRARQTRYQRGVQVGSEGLGDRSGQAGRTWAGPG